MPLAIISLDDARHGSTATRSRVAEVPRHPALTGDPDWCSPRLRLNVRGRSTDFLLAGAMAAALGVCRDTLLRLEARGVVPPARYFAPGGWPGNGQARLYPRRQVLRTAGWIDEQGLRGRRLSYQREVVAEALQRIADEEHAAVTATLPSAPVTRTSA